ncbi:hypothetical protein AB0O00_40245, partial [Kitasatospora sp. NPDC093558]
MPDLPARLSRALDVWLPRQRWYAGKDRTHTRVSVVQDALFSRSAGRDGATGLILVVRVDFDDGASEHYQVPVGIRSHPPQSVAPYVIAGLDDLVVYEATGDHDLVRDLLDLVAKSRPVHPLGFSSEPSPDRTAWPPPAPPRTSRPLGADQSNSSVVVDDRYLVKFFRRLHPGVNPDLELQRALRSGTGRYTAPLHGAIEGRLDGAPVTYAVV